MVPVPHEEVVSEGYVVPATAALPAPLKGSRSDIALQLGAPEYRFDGDDVWVYHWTGSSLGLFAVSYFPPVPPVYVNTDSCEHFVVFRFSREGQLLGIDRLVGSYPWSGKPDWRAALDEWLHPGKYPGKDEKNRPELKPEPRASPRASPAGNAISR
jgi:hypothetical protein